MVEFTRRQLLGSSAAAAIGLSAIGTASAADDDDTPNAPWVDGEIKRFSTTALGAEVTGPEVTDAGELLFSLQHPSRDNPKPFDKGAVGVFDGFTFEFDGANDDFSEVSVPKSESERAQIRSGSGAWRTLVQEGEPIDGGTEQWGHPQTPDGEDVSNFAGSQYGDIGYNPDMNHLVTVDDDGLLGYLFTNVETSPGDVVRTPLYRDDQGKIQADADNAINLVNQQNFRDLGGTRVNCYGDHTPWNTPVSSEEDYSHPRVMAEATVSDVDEADSGVGLRGAAAFWNRPNPSEIPGALDDIFGDGGWYPQGAWALGGIETLAYTLGVDPVDQEIGSNTIEPLGEGYPNKYRYGKQVEITEPTAEEPTPVKHHVFGRAAWECPAFMPDRRTVYQASDGTNKGLYKFVAEEPIPEYDDRMDVRGTLYAATVTNDAMGNPAETVLEIDWLPLGTASNREVEAWIAEYDGLTQVDYLETHAETNWEDDLEAALAEADEAVAMAGNQDYIPDAEVLEWAEQYERDGPDGVDEALRRVPFLETRAAAKEVGATIEFRKAEGIDVRDGARPGDFCYFGISELNSGMTDENGDLQVSRVDGGLVYRAELEPDYDVSTLEPAVVGADATDGPGVSADAILNIDNVKVLRDGRVILCEDADQFGREFPNDSMWVYQPPTVVDVESLAVAMDETGEVDVTVSSVPEGLAGGELTVSVTHPEVAEIVDATVPGDVGLTRGPTINSDGSTVRMRFADLDDAIDPGDADVPLATLELRGTGAGRADLAVAVEAFDDDTGTPIQPQARAGLVIVGPPAIGDNRPPTDPDGDGRFEDLNGNGRMDYDDVRLLFEHLDDPAVSGHVRAYDFNENGQLDFDDVVELYGEL